jgi:hypothetical protein
VPRERLLRVAGANVVQFAESGFLSRPPNVEAVSVLSKPVFVDELK